MATVSLSTLNSLLEKTSDWDKDERYMATSDLCNLLSKDVRLEEHMEAKVCQAILKQLDDQSNDVQSVAVKCLAVLLKRVGPQQLGEIGQKLVCLVLEGKDSLRDIYSIGLKTLIADAPEAMGTIVTDKLTNKLLNGLKFNTSEDVLRECLDNLTELLRRFGHLNEKEHLDIMV